MVAREEIFGRLLCQQIVKQNKNEKKRFSLNKHDNEKNISTFSSFSIAL